VTDVLDHFFSWNTLRELNRKFTDSDNSLFIRQKLSQGQVIASLQNELVSEHDRSTGNTITVYHIFLDCSEISI
jgi:hypothetical protein